MKFFSRLVASILALALIGAAIYGIWSGEMDNESLTGIQIFMFLFIGLIFGLYGITGESGISRGLWKLFGKPDDNNDT